MLKKGVVKPDGRTQRQQAAHGRHLLAAIGGGDGLRRRRAPSHLHRRTFVPYCSLIGLEVVKTASSSAA